MTETEVSTSRFRRWVPLLLLGALGLRLGGIWWGLPNEQHYFSYHPDEIFLLLPSFGFGQGDFNPHFFNYGTVYLYLVGLPAVALGLVPDPDQFPAGLRLLYLEGRLITALLGCATVLLLYLALRRESSWLGFLAACLLAICPLHVMTSHYATVDVPATFFIVLAFLFVMRTKDQPSVRAALPVGLAVGLAAATKYNAGLFLIPTLLAPLLLGHRPKVGWWFALPGAALLGFLIGNPFVASEEFLKGFLFEVRHAREGGTLAFVDTGSGWAYHLVRGLPVGLGYPLLAATVLGLVATVKRRSVTARLSLLWIVLYLFVIGFGRERFIRYLVPLTPFLCVLAAWGIMWLIDLARRHGVQVTATAVAGILVLLTALYSCGCLSAFLRLDPRDGAWRSAQTILNSRAEARNGSARLAALRPGLREPPLAPSRARIGLVSLPWYFDPPVSPHNAGRLSQAWFEEWNRAAGDPIVITGWELDSLYAALPVVFFLSDLEMADLQRLERVEVSTFLAGLEEKYGSAVYGTSAPPFSWLGPPRTQQPPDWLYPVPQITMYYGASRD